MKTRRLAGRVLGRRGHGKLVFLDLADRSGRIQLLCSADRTGPIDLDLGDIVGVVGKADQDASAASLRSPSTSSFSWPRPPGRSRTPSTGSWTPRRATASATSTCSSTRMPARTSSCAAGSSPRSAGTSTPQASSRWRRRPCSRATAAPSRSRSSRIRTSSTQTSTSASRPSSTSSASSSEGSRRSTSSARTSATRASRTSTSPSSPCWSGTRRTPTTRTRWRASRASSPPSRRRPPARRTPPSAGTRSSSRPPWQRLKLVDALEELGLWTRDEADLRSRMEERGVDTAADRSWSQLVDHALSHFIEPELIQPTILYDYPVELSPFARRTDDDPAFTERFEYFAAGMELGNAYSELNDPEEQAGALRRAGSRDRRRPGRSRLRRGARLRDAADGRARPRHRPARRCS